MQTAGTARTASTDRTTAGATGGATGSPSVQPAEPPRIVHPLPFTTSSDAARDDARACATALENNHLETARAKCGEAVAKDDGFALAHLWLGQSLVAPEAAAAEIRKAEERVQVASVGEQWLVSGWVAWREGRLIEARGDLDGLVESVPDEPRAWAIRGQLRQALGDLAGAVADFQKAVALDGKYGAGHNLLGLALAAQGQVDAASAAMHKYVEVAGSEPNAHDSLGGLFLRSGDLPGAIAAARRAIALDPKFLLAHLTLGDALLFQGKGREARREYAALEGAEDPALRHAGAMHAARSFVFEDKSGEAERALVREGDGARKARRFLESTEAFLEAARIQVERGALAEAGRGLQEATASLAAVVAGEPPQLDELAHRQMAARLLEGRALALAALRERALAEVKAEELAAQLRALSQPGADDHVAALGGYIAWKSGDEGAAADALEKADVAPLRLARAQLLLHRGDKNAAGLILDELAHRTSNDLDTALTRLRARKLLASAEGR